MPSEIRKPNFFHVGVGRTGTTSLSIYFKEHPNIYIPRKKELHYFSNEIIYEMFKHSKSKVKHFVLNRKRYLDFYRDANDEKIVVDISPVDCLSKTAAKRIYRFNPNAKILFGFREPIEQMYSTYVALSHAKMETEPDFLKAIDRNRKEKEGMWSTREFYLNSVKYAKMLQRFLDVFPRDQIMIYFFKNFKKDNKKVYRRILDFMGVSWKPPEEFKRYNSNRRTRSGFITSFAEFIFAKFDLSWLIKKKFIMKLAYLYAKWSTVPFERKKLPEDVYRKLQEKFKPNVKNLEMLLKKHDFVEKDFDLLEFWGY